MKYPVEGFSSTRFFSEQEKKDSRTTPAKTIKDLDELKRLITPKSGHQQSRLDAIANLEKILLSAEGQKFLETNETEKLKIVHLLEDKIYYDMADDVQTEAKNLLIKICPSMRQSITERLSKTAKGEQVHSSYLTSKSVRAKPSPHQTQVAQELLSSYDENRQRIEATNTAICTSTAGSSYTQLASIFAQHLEEATASSPGLTSASMFSCNSTSMRSSSGDSGIRHRTAQPTDPFSATLPFLSSNPG